VRKTGKQKREKQEIEAKRRGVLRK